jgi:hypothetical protein
MITDTITKLIGDAMKARDEIRLSTLRMLSSALNYEKIAKQHDLNEEEELVVVRRELKKRKDAIEAYEKAGATDRAEKERKEGEILEAYLPAQMEDAELEKIVKDAIAETGAQGLSEIGKIMGAVMPKVAGKADGGRVSGMVKKLLS